MTMEMCTLAAKSNTSLAQKRMLSQIVDGWQFSTLDEAPLSKQTFRIISKLLCSGKNAASIDSKHSPSPKECARVQFCVTSKIMPIHFTRKTRTMIHHERCQVSQCFQVVTRSSPRRRAWPKFRHPPHPPR